MTNDARNGDKQDTRTAEEAALSARLRHLGDRLGQQPRQTEIADAAQSDESAAKRASGIALGFRLSSELVAGVLVGGGIGWGLDRLLGISPWGLIVFLLLGFTAGVLNVMRSAGVIAKQSERSNAPSGALTELAVWPSIRFISLKSRSWRTVAHIGGTEIYFTNSALFMLISVGLTMLLLLGTTAGRRLVPSRMQSVAELSYEFVANTIRTYRRRRQA